MQPNGISEQCDEGSLGARINLRERKRMPLRLRPTVLPQVSMLLLELRLEILL